MKAVTAIHQFAYPINVAFIIKMFLERVFQMIEISTWIDLKCFKWNMKLLISPLNIIQKTI